MPKGYLIAHVQVTDEMQYQRYIRAASAAIEGSGCRMLVRGGPLAVKEGHAEWNRVVILEFDSFEAANAYYDSDAYQAAKALRAGAAVADFVIAQGV